MWGIIWQLRMLLLRLWKQLTTMDYEMPSLSNILWVQLARFASMAWSIVLESMILSQLGLAWLLRFLQLEWNYFVYLVTVLWSNASSPFSIRHGIEAQFKLIKQKFSNKTHFMFIHDAFKSHMEWSNAECVKNDTAKYSVYFPWHELFWSCDICSVN